MSTEKIDGAEQKKIGILEKIFGKNSTGILYILSVCALLLMLGAFVASYVFKSAMTPLALIGYSVFVIFAFVLITLPLAAQKLFRIYIPPAVEGGMCLYSVMYLLDNVVRPDADDIFVMSFTPAIGGFFIAMAVFSAVLSVTVAFKEKRGKKASCLMVTATSFIAATLVITLLNVTVYGLSVAFLNTPALHFKELMVQTGSYEGGVFCFCLLGGISMRVKGGESYRIRSFREADKAKSLARGSGNRSFLTVVDNITGDDTDYRRIYRRAKAGFFLGRIFYLAIYGCYVAYASIGFFRLGGPGYAVIGCLAAGFALTSALYIYEYLMYRRGTMNQRLRKLKIIRSSVRVYSLVLIAVTMMVANSSYNAITALASVGMIIFNLSVFFYNLFGKPKNYPALKKDGTAAGEPANL